MPHSKTLQKVTEKSMAQNSSWEGNRFTASQITWILWYPKVHYRLHKSTPTVPIPSQNNEVHTLPSYSFNINFNIIFPSTPWSSEWPLCFTFPHQNPVCISVLPTRATWPTHLILLCFFTLMEWKPKQHVQILGPQARFEVQLPSTHSVLPSCQCCGPEAHLHFVLSAKRIKWTHNVDVILVTLRIHLVPNCIVVTAVRVSKRNKSVEEKTPTYDLCYFIHKRTHISCYCIHNVHICHVTSYMHTPRVPTPSVLIQLSRSQAF